MTTNPEIEIIETLPAPAKAAAPDKEKLMAWAASVRAIEAPSFASPEAIEIARFIKDGLEQFAQGMERDAANLGQSKAA